jgi:hypothetical protein
MITINVLFTVWAIISYFKIKKVCKEKNKDFNPFETDNISYFLGFILGSGFLLASIISACLTYLP